MTLTVLTDDQIRSLLENLTVAELEGFRNALASALHEHSTGIDGETSVHQPERVSVHSSATNATTLFMPSCNSSGHGVKVITLTSAATNTNTNTNTNPTKPTPKPATIPPTGAITLFTPHGPPLGLLHASTLTAFRTALASLCLVQRRTAPLRTLVAFGCGEQAYWHVRLTLLLRGDEVKRVVFVNRRVSDSSKRVVERLEGWKGGKGCEFLVLTREEERYGERVKEVLREADVVFCCTPSTEPLFDAGMLLEGGGEGKGRLIVAIGSYTPEMREVPRELVEGAVSGEGGREAGVIVVDTIEGAMKEAGELIEVGVKAEQLVELGEVVMLKDSVEEVGNTRRHCLSQWLETGNVIYKSVGVGLMDLSIGMHIIGFAKEKGVGTHVEGF